MLAPLAGVSDHPFRRICSRLGADLTYIEMLSATALIYNSKRTYDMLVRHESEHQLGVQVTGKTVAEFGQAVSILDRLSMETIDLNMGCPVTKVTKSGSGSALLKEPEKVYQVVKAAREATAKPLSVKIRLGWDAQTVTAFEVADAVEQAGGEWLTVHGRLRNQDYGNPVNLDMIAAMKQRLAIPVIGNGNIFTAEDQAFMVERTGVDGVMVSRGALGNPWIFRDLRLGSEQLVTLEEWAEVVDSHLRWQGETYGERGMGAVCMRKHLLWYCKGFKGARQKREEIVSAETISDARQVIEAYVRDLREMGVTHRDPVQLSIHSGRFAWDPKYEMDRKLDRGVGHDGVDGVFL